MSEGYALRFIERDGEKVLQQYVLKMVLGWSQGVESQGSWEDVPCYKLESIEQED